MAKKSKIPKLPELFVIDEIDLNYHAYKHPYLMKATYKRELIDMRFVNIVSALINRYKASLIYRINLSALAIAVNMENNDQFHRSCREMVERFKTGTVKVQRLDSDGFIECPWMEKIEYDPEAGYMDVRLNPVLLPYIFSIRNIFG